MNDFFFLVELRGLSEQADVGFMTLMEELRYCTVGSFYKNPKNPVWVMASETHLSGINQAYHLPIIIMFLCI